MGLKRKNLKVQKTPQSLCIWGILLNYSFFAVLNMFIDVRDVPVLAEGEDEKL